MVEGPIYAPVSLQDGPSDQDETIPQAQTAAHDEPNDSTRHDAGAPGYRDDSNPAKDSLFPSARLYRSGYIILLALLYISMALFSWIITCRLSFRPIGVSKYGFWTVRNNKWAYLQNYPVGANGYPQIDNSHDQVLYIRNERWYRAARIIQSIVSVLTIPLTSAVCSSAAVIFIQRRQAHGRLSIRQVMTLADKGWTDLPTYARILPLFATDGWKRYGSSFLLLAMFVNILGSVISPLQQIFLSTTTIKRPTEISSINGLFDFSSTWWKLVQDVNSLGSNDVVVLTRSALTSATASQPMAQLWPGIDMSCNLDSKSSGGSQNCDMGAFLTLGNISALPDSFIAQLPNTFDTGLIRQFIPRINSSARYETIEESDFPNACDRIPGSFFVDYSYVNTNYTGDFGPEYFRDAQFGWGLKACMPANVANSWNSTRDRQDFSEELHLNVTVLNLTSGNIESGFYKITLDTTAGYFELPNYMNQGVAGPLLDKDPIAVCGDEDDCVYEWMENL
jgi:hypothetical protein